MRITIKRRVGRTWVGSWLRGSLQQGVAGALGWEVGCADHYSRAFRARLGGKLAAWITSSRALQAHSGEKLAVRVIITGRSGHTWVGSWLRGSS